MENEVERDIAIYISSRTNWMIKIEFLYRTFFIYESYTSWDATKLKFFLTVIFSYFSNEFHPTIIFLGFNSIEPDLRVLTKRKYFSFNFFRYYCSCDL